MHRFLVSIFALAAMTSVASSAHATDEWGDQVLHSYETAVEFTNLEGRDFENTRTIRMNFPKIQCVESVQISAWSTIGSGVLFLIGMGANNPEPLDQDIHAGTVTLPPARIDPHYPMRVDRMTRQVFFLVSGGTVHIHRARAIVVPDSMCPQL